MVIDCNALYTYSSVEAAIFAAAAAAAAAAASVELHYTVYSSPRRAQINFVSMHRVNIRSPPPPHI